MAGANLPAKKYTKTSPTVTRLSFECDGGSTQFIDIGLAMSAINRKFYRQGVYYYVNSVEIYNNETGVVDLHTAPDNYITKNAWNRGFRTFQKMNNLVDVPRPKYHDFKVYLNDLHRSTGTKIPALHGINGAWTNVNTTPDDWDYSKLVSADDDGDHLQEADDMFMHLIGPHVGATGDWTSVGLIQSYGDTRGQPTAEDPVVPSEARGDPLINLFDFSSEEQLNDIITNLDLDNESAPYDRNGYVGANVNNLQHVARIGTEVGVGRVGRASGFCAPFGLICIDPHGVSTAFRVVINLAQGTYHGVYGERA